MTNKITLTLQLGQIRHEATLNLPPGFSTPDIFDQEQDALLLLSILQYTARNTLWELEAEIVPTTTAIAEKVPRGFSSADCANKTEAAE